MKCASYFFGIIAFSTALFGQTFNAHRAGSWYPKDTQELTQLLKAASNTAAQQFAMQTDHAQIRALICPHAGYTYSGIIAAAAYNLVRHNNIDQIIIVGPSHFKPLNGIAIPAFKKYQTPLGTLSVQTSAWRTLSSHALVSQSDEYFNPEHSIEMQLPFIQYALPNAKIIPILVGHVSDSEVTAIAALLKPLITQKTLVIISSDFTHYGKDFEYVPFTDNILLNINQLDSSVLNPIQHQNRAAFEAIINTTKDTVCGRNPIRILLELIKQNALGVVSVRLVAHGTSYAVTRDEKSVVSYASLIVTNELKNDILNKQEQTSLLTYARNTLEQAFKKTLDAALLKPIMTNLLEKPQGVFPTLWALKNGQKELRGCIGQVTPAEPLYQAVAEKTLDSAFEDPRFSPVQAAELANIRIEISVLKEPKRIASYKEIKLNEQGIILTQGTRSALFLPKVPKEHGFDLTQTLQELSKKAGLDKNAWKSPSTTFQVFEAQDFEESFPTK